MPDGSEPGSLLAHLFFHSSQDKPNPRFSSCELIRDQDTIYSAKNSAVLMPDGLEPRSMLAHFFIHSSQNNCQNTPLNCVPALVGYPKMKLNAVKNSAVLMPDGSEPGTMLAHLFLHSSKNNCQNKPSTECLRLLVSPKINTPAIPWRVTNINGPRLQIIYLMKSKARSGRVRRNHL